MIERNGQELRSTRNVHVATSPFACETPPPVRPPHGAPPRFAGHEPKKASLRKSLGTDACSRWNGTLIAALRSVYSGQHRGSLRGKCLCGAEAPLSTCVTQSVGVQMSGWG